jgi:hypothetical protein
MNRASALHNPSFYCTSGSSLLIWGDRDADRERVDAHIFVHRNIEKPSKVYIFVDNSNSQSKLTVFRAVLQSCIAEPRLKLQVGVLGCRVSVAQRSIKTGLAQA